jgi:hypothetical protein
MEIIQNALGLSIRINNRLGDAIDLDERASRIARMLAEARDEHLSRADEELGSGFGKIIRIIKYDIPTAGSFNITVTNDRDVVVHISIPTEVVA